MQSRSHSTLAIILANLVPLFGVIFLKWTVFSVVFLFWLESVMIGFFNVLKMLFAQNVNPKLAYNQPTSQSNEGCLKAFLIPFFTVHYGMFMLGQGIFIFVLIGGQKQANNESEFFTFLAQDKFFWIALICLFISHLYNFIRHYMIGKEYQKNNISNLMFMPYGRVFIQQFVIIGGAFLLQAFKSNFVFLALLIFLKILADLRGAGLEDKKSNRNTST